jgi:SPP1 gp7 family putative phage head morphogenesis protein
MNLPTDRKWQLFSALKEAHKKFGQSATIANLPSLWQSAIENVEKKPKPIKSVVGELTKRQMTDLPGHHEQNLVTAHYAPLVRKAIADGMSGLKEAVAQAVAGHSQGSKASAKVTAKQSVQHNIRFDSAPLQAVLKGIYADNGLIALKPKTTSKAAGLSSDLEALAGGIDWSNWKPGNPEAAAKVAGGGLKSLLDNSNATIKGITDTTMARLGDLIAAGIDQGLPSSDIADSLDAIVNDPARAEMIAQTEGSRAYNASSIDSMVDAGLPGFEWLAYDGACDECADMEGNHDFGDEYPPLHPNCRCAIVGQSTVSADEINE